MPTLIVLVGPTGVGKTELSLSLAEELNTCIISADSRQLYADLKIGTAAPTTSQLSRVKHYFVGTLSLTDYYSAAQYEAEVMQLLDSLFSSHHTILLTGGSMMYIDAVCNGIDDIPTVDAETRQLMRHRYETEGLEQLCSELRLLDPRVLPHSRPEERQTDCSRLGNLLHDGADLHLLPNTDQEATPLRHRQDRTEARPRRTIRTHQTAAWTR